MTSVLVCDVSSVSVQNATSQPPLTKSQLQKGTHNIERDMHRRTQRGGTLHTQVLATRKSAFAMSHAKRKNKWCTKSTRTAPKARIDFNQNEFCLEGWKSFESCQSVQIGARFQLSWPWEEGSMEARRRASSG